MNLSAANRPNAVPYSGPRTLHEGPAGGASPAGGAGAAGGSPPPLVAASLRGRSDGAPRDVRGAEPPAGELRQAFQDFVGQTLFGSMLASMRATVGQPAYLHGGRTEEVFQKQLDQHLVESLSDATADTISDPMFELFQMQRRA